MMSHHDVVDDGEDTFVVVRNDEGQYSVWWDDLRPPAGWTAVGSPASRRACLDRICELWTDMRPLSLRARVGEPDRAR